MEFMIIAAVLGLPIVILFAAMKFVGRKCIHKKCNRMAKVNHSFCKECEKIAGIYTGK